jgi:hypothetical protein
MRKQSVQVLSGVLLVTMIAMLALDAVLLVSSPFWLAMLYNMGPIDLSRSADEAVRILIPTGTHVFMQVFVALSGIALGGILYEAIRILRRVQKGDPFCMGVARALNASAWFSLAQMGLFAAKMFNGPTVLTAGCIGIFLIAAMLYFVLAGLFHAAALMREDHDLTI